MSLTLKKLDCAIEAGDDMLDTIRSEVKRLGTRKAIASEIMQAEIGDTTDYVIGRPRKAMTTRDYLNDKHRCVLLYVVCSYTCNFTCYNHILYEFNSSSQKQSIPRRWIKVWAV